MAAAQVATFQHDLNNGMNNLDYAKKAPVAPPSPDGAEMAPPTKSAPTKALPSAPVELQVQPTKPTLTVPSIASRIQSKKAEPEERKAHIRRLASQAFEKQTGKTFTGEDMSAAEWAVYNAEVKKSEEVLDRKKAEEEAAIMLANNIKYREHHLNEMTVELSRKIEQYQIGQEELTQITKDFEETVAQQLAAAPQESTGVKSSNIRMEEEKRKKALKAAWRHSTSSDPVTQARQRQYAAAEDIAGLKARIEEARKELGRMMGKAQKGKSSLHRMREEKEKKAEAKRSGIVPEAGPVKIHVKREPEVRSHQQRMKAEQERKAEARRQARMSLDVTELAGRPRSGTTSF